MASDQGPYARVYFSVIDDPKFIGVYDDDRHFATWVRLLIGAEAKWPASADLPTTCRKASVDFLVSQRIVTLGTNGRYRIQGLDAERARRADNARNAAAVRWGNAGASSVSNAGAMPRARGDETSIDEQSKAEPVNGSAPDDALDTYYRLTLRYPSGRTKAWITELANEFGHRETGMAIASEYKASDDLRTILSRVDGRLRSEAHHAELERAKPKARTKLTDEDLAERDRQRLAIVQEWSEPA